MSEIRVGKMMSIRTGFLAGALFAAVVAGIGGCTQIQQTPQPEANTTDVRMENLAFAPKEVTINRGDKVRWTNAETGLISHTSTSGDPDNPDHGSLWDSKTLAPGASFTHQFDEIGEFEYYCVFHYQMGVMRHAKVIVVETQP